MVFGKILRCKLFAEISLEKLAPGGVLQSPDGFFLDLTDALPCKIELGADLIECEAMVHANPIIEVYDIPFLFRKCGKAPLYLFIQ